ncbi:acetyltransferase [Vibrio neptunius]|uniref:GNAT family N-acetyltransferase n=1 Tax=Vibrio neptunius TaxID=170651 RepID=UPI0005FA13D5|nr:GNAT family N-acetyltransferase [Vibrio neptunius]KJY91434.1 acetyltransferase [Vibrio neptunius]
MVKLREMRSEEFAGFYHYAAEAYAQDIAENQGHAAEKSLELAHHALERCFPDGVETKSQSLLCIDSEQEGASVLAGYLWHCVNQQEGSTFIYDFYVIEAFRGKGIGSKAIELLEAKMENVGIKQIKLRVAFNNERARKLYEELGFVVTGYNMSKVING